MANSLVGIRCIRLLSSIISEGFTGFCTVGAVIAGCEAGVAEEVWGLSATGVAGDGGELSFFQQPEMIQTKATAI